jgi:hypothetical protein
MPGTSANGCACPPPSPPSRSELIPLTRTDAMPKPALADGFEWDPVYDELLDQTATSNVVECVPFPSS